MDDRATRAHHPSERSGASGSCQSRGSGPSVPRTGTPHHPSAGAMSSRASIRRGGIEPKGPSAGDQSTAISLPSLGYLPSALPLSYRLVGTACAHHSAHRAPVLLTRAVSWVAHGPDCQQCLHGDHLHLVRCLDARLRLDRQALDLFQGGEGGCQRILRASLRSQPPCESCHQWRTPDSNW